MQLYPRLTEIFRAWQQLLSFPALGTRLLSFPALSTSHSCSRTGLFRALIAPWHSFTIVIGSCLSCRLSSTRCTSTSLDSTWFSTNQRKEAPERASTKWTRITCARSFSLKRSSWLSQLIKIIWYVGKKNVSMWFKFGSIQTLLTVICTFFHWTPSVGRILFFIKTISPV